jgi:hypothetical protein
MIGPYDLHSSPAPLFRTFQVFLTYFPKRPIFSTIKTMLQFNTLLVSSLNLSPVYWRKDSSSCRNSLVSGKSVRKIVMKFRIRVLSNKSTGCHEFHENRDNDNRTLVKDVNNFLPFVNSQPTLVKFHTEGTLAKFRTEDKWAKFRAEGMWTKFRTKGRWAKFRIENKWAKFRKEDMWYKFRTKGTWNIFHTEGSWPNFVQKVSGPNSVQKVCGPNSVEHL